MDCPVLNDLRLPSMANLSDKSPIPRNLGLDQSMRFGREMRIDQHVISSLSPSFPTQTGPTTIA